MKHALVLLAFILLNCTNSPAQQTGLGCQYQPGFRGELRVYQQRAPSPSYSPSVPTFHYSTNTLLPVKDKCYNWVLYGGYQSCYVYDGWEYYAGYLGTMNLVECPIDTAIPLLFLLVSPFAIMVIRKKSMLSN